VVLVSKKGEEVEPAELQKMKDSFARQNFNFTSFKRLSQQTLEVSSQESTEVKLPNGVNASLRLLRLQGDTATLRVEVPQLSAVDVELGREGVVYQRAGKHVGGELILVLSSPPAK
jgi:predicted DNA binding CopG/RHH family protein